MPTTPLPNFITHHTTLPLIAAPMFLVSGPELVIACCKAGIVGSFPFPNARPIRQLENWMEQITAEYEAVLLREKMGDAWSIISRAKGEWQIGKE